MLRTNYLKEIVNWSSILIVLIISGFVSGCSYISTSLPATIVPSIPVFSPTVPTIAPTIVPSSSPVPTATDLPTPPDLIGQIAYTDDISGISLFDLANRKWSPLSDRRYVDPTWSPDGQWIAFVFGFGRDSRSSSIGIMQKNGGGFKQITFAPHFKFTPAWSPDGKYIAYVEMGDDQSLDIVVTSIEGQITYKLTYTPGDDDYPSWAPDSKTIAYLYTVTPRDDPSCPNQFCTSLMTMNSDGSNAHRVIDILVGRRRPGWSPDGNKIAFVSAGCGQVYITNISDGNPIEITTFPGCTDSPVWSPDGNYIAFVGFKNPNGDTMSQSREIYVVGVDGGPYFQLSQFNNDDGEVRRSIPIMLAWSPVPSLRIGQNYILSSAETLVNIYDTSSLQSKALSQLSPGEEFVVLEGPVDTSNYYWWRIRTENGTEGWVFELAGLYKSVK